MNLVERFFAALPGDAAELRRRIEACLPARNLNPKPYRRKAKRREILEKIYLAHQTVSAVYLFLSITNAMTQVDLDRCSGRRQAGQA
ncbi:MAG: hypothetical protein ACRD36_14280 [Candidatus Acidiferrum sp.]